MGSVGREVVRTHTPQPTRRRSPHGFGARAAALALLAGVVLAAVVAAPVAGASGTPTPPGQQTTGYGSQQHAISPYYLEGQTGNELAGTYVWWYVPHTLLHGTTAPVVVILHGFELQAPQIYQGLIDHLTSEGYIVVFPQYNLAGLIGILEDTNQNAMESRAIAAVNTALGWIGSRADRSNIYLWGHSLGGELATCWTQDGGVPVRAITFANPSVNPDASLPSFVSSLVHITQVPWQSCAARISVPTMILTGSSDTIAPPAADPTSLYDGLTAASSRVLYEAHTDTHGSPALTADHMASTTSTGILPSFLADLILDGTGTQDALDYRYYWAALDAQLAGRTGPPSTRATGVTASPSPR